MVKGGYAHTLGEHLLRHKKAEGVLTLPACDRKGSSTVKGILGGLHGRNELHKFLNNKMHQKLCEPHMRNAFLSERTMTGTGLKKCRPTTLEVLSLLLGSAAVLPSGMVEAAILVMLIEDVFVARMVFGDSSADSERKIFCLTSKFSETA